MASNIFILEDDTDVLDMVRPAIERQGWRFMSAGRAEGVLAGMRSFNPDVIILDVGLPDGNGYQVCEQIRGDERLAKIPVIFLTARGEVKSRLDGFAAGGVDYIPKPFAVEELLARIRAQLSVKKELDALAREKDELAVLTQVRQDLFDMIVHDLRNPIGAIQMILCKVREAGLLADYKHASLLDHAENAARFSLLMLNDILELDTGKLRVEPASLGLKALIERLQSFFSLQIKRREAAVEFDLPPEDKVMTTDPILVFRVLANLLTNALKFTRQGDRLHIKGRYTAAGLRLEVTDQGRQIPDSEKEKIFKKYYRTTASQSVEGTGIGLSFCRLACETLGGRIWVEDARGGGNRFVVELPDLKQEGKRAKEPVQTLFGESCGSGLRKEYLDNCRAKLARARELAREFSGPGTAGALTEVRNIAHQLAGSAGTYGFTSAGLSASSLEDLLSGRGAAGEGVKEQALSLIDSISAELGLS